MYITDASYKRLREVSLTYSAPQSVASLLRARNATFTFAGRNLKTWTKYTGLDPETTYHVGGGVLHRARGEEVHVPRQSDLLRWEEAS